MTRRLVVRRTRLTDTQQLKLPDWRHFGFLTDLEGTAVELDKFHRQNAVVELAIRDLIESAGLKHVPSGNFANSAWLPRLGRLGVCIRVGGVWCARG